jgi:hypothetical protein
VVGNPFLMEFSLRDWSNGSMCAGQTMNPRRRNTLGCLWNSIAKTNLHDVVQQIPQIHICSISPMDAARLNLNDEGICTLFLQSQHSIDTAPASFACNVNGLGDQEFSDVKQHLCIVPAHVIEDVY